MAEATESSGRWKKKKSKKIPLSTMHCLAGNSKYPGRRYFVRQLSHESSGFGYLLFLAANPRQYGSLC